MDDTFNDFDNDFDGEFDDIPSDNPSDNFYDDTIKDTNAPCGPLDAEDWMIIGPLSERIAWERWERKRLEYE